MTTDERLALVVGEALIDRVDAGDGAISDRPGGSAANVAVALARLDRPVRFATSYGNDAYGQLLTDHLAADGVALAADPYVVPRTSVALAKIGADGAATYEFDVAWELGPVEVLAPHVVHVGSLGPVLEPGAEAVRALVDRLRTATTVSYDINARPAITGVGPDVVERVEQMAARADLIKASDEDLEVLWPDLSADQAAAHLLDLGAVAVVETRGGEGAYWSVRTAEGDRHGQVAAPTTTVVDTIGAGDTFGAGLIDALWDLLGAGGRERLAEADTEAWDQAVGHAARCAAVTVSRLGADPPRRQDL